MELEEEKIAEHFNEGGDDGIKLRSLDSFSVVDNNGNFHGIDALEDKDGKKGPLQVFGTVVAPPELNSADDFCSSTYTGPVKLLLQIGVGLDEVVGRVHLV
jgi:hypothetical protein